MPVRFAVSENTGGYYSERLSAERLRKCYEIAPPRVRRYLDCEIRHVAARLGESDIVLDLGCGYGRIMERLADSAGLIVGIDTSPSSLRLGREYLRRYMNCRLIRMDAGALAFCNDAFDVVLCLQNGLSAFKVDRSSLVRESLRVTRPGGRIFLSSYSENFWQDRLEWFQMQSDHGLLGEIDQTATGDGVIVCKDGFVATTVSAEEFATLTSGLGTDIRIEEVDGSSIFCEITV